MSIKQGQYNWKRISLHNKEVQVMNSYVNRGNFTQYSIKPLKNWRENTRIYPLNQKAYIDNFR